MVVDLQHGTHDALGFRGSEQLAPVQKLAAITQSRH
jgi:hypothetical protein